MVESDGKANGVVEGEIFGAPVPGRWPGTSAGEDAARRGRYRWRTRLRAALPHRMTRLISKGSKDCGDHEWHKANDAEDRCYHCEVGLRRPSEF